MESLRSSKVRYGYNSVKLQLQKDRMEMDSTNIDLFPATLVTNKQMPVQHFQPTNQHQHRNLNALGDELAPGDRSPQMPNCSVNTLHDQSTRKKVFPLTKVTISNQSSMYIYNSDPFYTRNKSYTKAERANFTSETLSEVVRIKQLIMSLPGASAKDSFKYLLKNNILSLEEMVGIEQLVLCKSMSKLLKERQDHARAVLAEQGRQRMNKTVQGDPTEKIGELSCKWSIRSAKKARIRGAMAA
mmetsp:Transcript_6542/g.12639  ORF Transcript_6542/g.12639 Transcript_6542/m.12639 type:complete len:243 (-) Transcript_6542:110-838(-)|eukprot:CAMPEP_0196136962 /NCGR_PEP_ID=MMETSP0910-20130528/5094_1 /TAXON_ID=49265 /ORGANISM="Thalassiosira rotula, Strain GSO102" /LENGTH=242 /DNA_ID=CAMNT_0041397333 /DNA_START=88 /DNA_END=816 /DNA_ORIENTATION=+